MKRSRNFQNGIPRRSAACSAPEWAFFLFGLALLGFCYRKALCARRWCGARTFSILFSMGLVPAVPDPIQSMDACCAPAKPNMKRIASVLLALFLCLSVSAPALAVSHYPEYASVLSKQLDDIVARAPTGYNYHAVFVGLSDASSIERVVFSKTPTLGSVIYVWDGGGLYYMEKVTYSVVGTTTKQIRLEGEGAVGWRYFLPRYVQTLSTASLANEAALVRQLDYDFYVSTYGSGGPTEAPSGYRHYLNGFTVSDLLPAGDAIVENAVAGRKVGLAAFLVALVPFVLVAVLKKFLHHGGVNPMFKYDVHPGGKP